MELYWSVTANSLLLPLIYKVYLLPYSYLCRLCYCFWWKWQATVCLQEVGKTGPAQYFTLTIANYGKISQSECDFGDCSWISVALCNSSMLTPNLTQPTRCLSVRSGRSYTLISCLSVEMPSYKVTEEFDLQSTGGEKWKSSPYLQIPKTCCPLL